MVLSAKGVAGGSAVELHGRGGAVGVGDVRVEGCGVVEIISSDCWSLCGKSGLGALDGEEERDGSGGLSHCGDESYWFIVLIVHIRLYTAKASSSQSDYNNLL